MIVMTSLMIIFVIDVKYIKAGQMEEGGSKTIVVKIMILVMMIIIVMRAMKPRERL